MLLWSIMTTERGEEDEKLVSIIIPTYNRSELLTNAIESVLAQTYKNIEIIIVDDGSTDSTPKISEKYNNCAKVKYLRLKENSGGYNGIPRNRGINIASGDLIAFLDDDDEWEPTKLEKQVSLYESSNKWVGLIYCWMEIYNQGVVQKRNCPKYQGSIFKEMLDKNAITNSSTLLIPVDILESVDGFDESLKRGVDSDLIRRIAKDYHVNYVPEVLVKYNVGHEYQRVSSEDCAGLRDAIDSARMKFKKFPDSFNKYQDTKANNLAYIGHNYILLKEYKKGLEYFYQAIREDSKSLTVYKWIGRAIRNTVFK